MTIIDKAGQIGLLLSVGMRKNSIKKIFIYHGLMMRMSHIQNIL